MEKINEAIARITKECEGKDYLIPFEEYLTSICTTDSVANKILAKDKSLAGAFNKMKSIAEDRQVDGCAYIPPEEGFEIIRNYYGINLNESEEDDNSIDITDLFDF